MSNKRVCFAASSGGHFEQLLMLRPLMDKYDCCVVTEKTRYNVDLDKKLYLLSQVNRHEISFLPRMLLNAVKSLYIVIKEKPQYIITTGVLAVIPLCLLIKLFGGKLIYIESFAKVNTPTITGKILYNFADSFYVQWEDMKKLYPKAIYLEGIY